MCPDRNGGSIGDAAARAPGRAPGWYTGRYTGWYAAGRCGWPLLPSTGGKVEEEVLEEEEEVR